MFSSMTGEGKGTGFTDLNNISDRKFTRGQTFRSNRFPAPFKTPGPGEYKIPRDI